MEVIDPVERLVGGGKHTGPAVMGQQWCSGQALHARSQACFGPIPLEQNTKLCKFVGIKGHIGIPIDHHHRSTSTQRVRAV